MSVVSPHLPDPQLDARGRPRSGANPDATDQAWQRVFHIALVMAGGFVLSEALFFAQPGPGPFLEQVPAVLRVMITAVPTVWLGYLLARQIHRKRYPKCVLPRRLCISGTVALLGPFMVEPVITLASHPLLLAACVPTTAFGLWTMFTVQRYRRMPVRLYLVVFAWGAIVAAGLAGALNELFLHYAGPFYALFTGDNALEAAVAVRPLRGLNAGIVEELAKGAGVAAACLLARRRIDGVVSGAVLGAACGLGFNFTETVIYMSSADGGAGAQYWARQFLGLLASHTAFSAVLGAAIGSASQIRDHRVRRTAITCGVVIAAGAHALYNAYTLSQGELLPAFSDLVQLLVVLPVSMLVLQGPLIVMQTVLVRRGLRTQTAGLTAELHAETADPSTVVIPAEVPILLDPRQRRALRIAALRRHGIPAYRNLRRLHAAQLDLAAYRWHRSRGETTDSPGHDHLTTLRERVQHHKQLHAALISGALR